MLFGCLQRFRAGRKNWARPNIALVVLIFFESRLPDAFNAAVAQGPRSLSRGCRFKAWQMPRQFRQFRLHRVRFSFS